MSENVLIVIPAFNEKYTIAAVVENCCAFAKVLVVDDGSSDGTGAIAEAAGAIVLSNGINQGYEYSLNVGYQFAVDHQYGVMITLDADGQLPAEKVPDFVAALQMGAGLAVGKRGALSRLSEKTLAFFSRRLSHLADPYCGMKAYDLRNYKIQKFSSYNSVGTGLAFAYLTLGAQVANIDIEIKAREGTVSKFGGVISSEFRLLPSMLVGILRLFQIRGLL